MDQDPPPPRDPKLPLPIVTIVLIATNIAAWVFSLTAGADPLMPNPFCFHSPLVFLAHIFFSSLWDWRIISIAR